MRKEEELYQRIFKDSTLRMLDDYAPPTQAQLQKRILQVDQSARCRTINFLQYNHDSQNLDVQRGL